LLQGKILASGSTASKRLQQMPSSLIKEKEGVSSFNDAAG
jgi:hypothetical protein